MSTIQWRPEVNALTLPQSYSMRFMPRNVLGNDELAAEMVKKNPIWNEGMAKACIDSLIQTIQEQLIAGNQVTLANAFTFSLSFTARLDTPDAPLPPMDELLQVRIYAAQPFVTAVRQEAQLEQLPAEEKLPLIVTAEDTRLKLNDVLYAKGVLRLAGSRLLFNQADPICGCFIEGTRSGKTTQAQFATISNTEILLVADIPAQNDPWNNEYILSVAARYTGRGTLRTGIYRRKLRAPIMVANFGDGMEYGILTGKAAHPYVSVIADTITADEMLRLQVIFDLRTEQLVFSLLDMSENGKAGAAVTVAANGAYVLPGFMNSAVSSMSIRVDRFSQLAELVRTDYSGRLVEVLDVKIA